MFSARVPSSLAPNRLAAAVERRRRGGLPILDLTESNPTRADFTYPDDLLQELGHSAGLVYEPQPLGLAVAREAVAVDYARRGIEVPPARIAVTAGSSESYSTLFKLLCDAGDEVLVPRPSYPLFEHLTALDAVVAVPYDLEYHGRWSIDVAGLSRRMSSRTRAVLIVSPNNPTGSFVTAGELAAIAGECAGRSVALIADEVFADYELTDGASARSGRPLAQEGCLAFGLGGLSKTVGLPQVKLGWIAVNGPDPIVREALERLEIVCDTYLSVTTPVQAAAARFLERGALIRAQIRRRIRENLQQLAEQCARSPSTMLLAAEGGWSAVLRVPSTGSEEDLVLDLLNEHGVLAHPGYFFDFPHEAFLVVSLLPPRDTFGEGVARMLAHVDSARASH
jgi:aspartate/methionine/tyrosine aminotransferase